MPINKERIRQKISLAISQMPTTITLKRIEQIDDGNGGYDKQEVNVATFDVFLDTKNSVLREQNFNDPSGNVTRIKSIKMLAVYDSNFEIKKGDYFYINGLKHTVVYPQNPYDIYWQCDVEVVL